MEKRELTINDIVIIIKSKGLVDPISLFNKLKKRGFGDIDLSLLLNAFGDAYGEDWLVTFYKENEDQLLNLYYK